MDNVARGEGIHTPDNTWKNKRHVFDLTLGAGTIKLPDSTTLDNDFEFEFDVKSVGSNPLEVRCADDDDVLEGHWRNKFPIWETDQNGEFVLNGSEERIFSAWGAVNPYGLFAGLTQTSGKVWKRKNGEYGFKKWRSVWSAAMSQDTVIADAVNKTWTVTPRSAGEVVIANPYAGAHAPQDIFLRIDDLIKWCPPHMSAAGGYGNYINHSVTFRYVGGNSDRVVGIGCHDGTHIVPNNDPDINPGFDRGYLYLTKPSTVILKITQSTVEMISYTEDDGIPTAREPV